MHIYIKLSVCYNYSNYKVITFSFLQPFSYRKNKVGLKWNFPKRSQCRLGREWFLSAAPGSAHAALLDGQALESASPEEHWSVCRANWNRRVSCGRSQQKGSTSTLSLRWLVHLLKLVTPFLFVHWDPGGVTFNTVSCNIHHLQHCPSEQSLK